MVPEHPDQGIEMNPVAFHAKKTAPGCIKIMMIFTDLIGENHHHHRKYGVLSSPFHDLVNLRRQMPVLFRDFVARVVGT